MFDLRARQGCLAAGDLGRRRRFEGTPSSNVHEPRCPSGSQCSRAWPRRSGMRCGGHAALTSKTAGLEVKRLEPKWFVFFLQASVSGSAEGQSGCLREGRCFCYANDTDSAAVRKRAHTTSPAPWHRHTSHPPSAKLRGHRPPLKCRADSTQLSPTCPPYHTMGHHSWDAGPTRLASERS